MFQTNKCQADVVILDHIVRQIQEWLNIDMKQQTIRETIDADTREIKCSFLSPETRIMLEKLAKEMERPVFKKIFIGSLASKHNTWDTLQKALETSLQKYRHITETLSAGW